MKKNIIKSLTITVLALLVIIIMVSSLGLSIFKINPVATKYNDELFYLKQIKSIWLSFAPMGNFGYNESSALIGGFGAWSPLIAYSYAIFGFVFQNSMHVIYFTNLFLILIAIFIITYLKKYKFSKSIFFLIPLFNCIVFRHVYSGMSEALFYVIGMLIAFLLTKETNKSPLCCGISRASCVGCILILIASLMRPYFVVFFPLLVFKEKSINLKNIGFTTLLIIITIIGYFTVNHYFVAEYLTPLLRFNEIFDWAIRGNFISSVVNLMRYIVMNVRTTIYFIKQSTSTGDMVGIIYLLYYLTTIPLILTIFVQIKDKKSLISNLFVFLVYIIAYLTIINLYAPYQGSRHVFIFIIFAWYYLILNNSKIYNIIILSAIVVSCNVIFVRDSYNLYNDEDWSMNNYINDIKLIESGGSRVDNTMLIEYGVDNSLYHILYYLNDTISINLCMSDYLRNNVDQLNYKYVILSKNSNNISIYKQKHQTVVENDWFAIYKLESMEKINEE